MPAGVNLVLADGDGVTGVRERLIDLWPPFADVAMLARPVGLGRHHQSGDRQDTAGNGDPICDAIDAAEGVLRDPLSDLQISNSRRFLSVPSVSVEAA